jgi:hypothetical protein
MREFTKSVMSYAWSQSLFGVQQMLNLFSAARPRQEHPSTEGFNSVAGCATEQMGDAMRATFRAGDNIQRAAVDLMFGVFTLGIFDRGRGGGDGSDYGRQAADIGGRTADAFQQGARAMGQAVDLAGQGARVMGRAGNYVARDVGATTAGRGSPDEGPRQQPTGWGPMPPPRD